MEHYIDFDDLVHGMMGDSGDEGIDLCYLFLNGKPLNNEVEKGGIKSESKISLKLFQIKKEESFSTEGFRKFTEGIKEVFNLDLPLDRLRIIGANYDFLNKVDLIRKTFREARVQSSEFSLECFYATASTSNSYSEKIKYLQEELQKYLSPYQLKLKFYYWTAQDLLNFTNKKEEKIEFVFESQPLMISERDLLTSGYVGFINGNKLMSILVDEAKEFRDELTDGNIRFFLGEDKQINSSIIDTV